MCRQDYGLIKQCLHAALVCKYLRNVETQVVVYYIVSILVDVLLFRPRVCVSACLSVWVRDPRPSV